jgi:hypothetical protein
MASFSKKLNSREFSTHKGLVNNQGNLVKKIIKLDNTLGMRQFII